jgi:nicotinic acid mononucleotide adenylyltransferase
MLSALRAFITAQDSVFVVSATAPSTYEKVVVLDASFNPPTTAHLSLVLATLARVDTCDAVVLQLALNNADKSTIDAATVLHRTHMMHLLGECIHHHHPDLPIHVAWTKEALFIHKEKTLRTLWPQSMLYFIMGMDTLQRLFMRRYYNDMETVLDAFLAKAYVVVGDRNHLRVDYMHDHVIRLDAFSSTVSSTLARQLLAHNADQATLSQCIPPSILEYMQHGQLQ